MFNFSSDFETHCCLRCRLFLVLCKFFWVSVEEASSLSPSYVTDMAEVEGLAPCLAKRENVHLHFQSIRCAAIQGAAYWLTSESWRPVTLKF